MVRAQVCSDTLFYFLLFGAQVYSAEAELQARMLVCALEKGSRSYLQAASPHKSVAELPKHSQA